MKNKRNNFKYLIRNPNSIFFVYIFAIIIFSLVIFASVVHASSTLGTIDPHNSGNYKAQLQNSSLGSATTINFGKFTTEASKNITVSNTELRGFAWGDGVGWIVMNCADTTSGCSGTNGNFKVANDGNGNLSGYAWGENTGWINFGPFTNSTISRVKITNGFFGGTLGTDGYAWAQNFGWIKFDCSSGASCVETDWGVTSSGGGGGGGGGGSSKDICPNIAGNQSLIPSGFVIDANGNCVTPSQCSALNGSLKQPLDVMIVIDKSGSMTSTVGSGGTKLTQAKNAATSFMSDVVEGSDRVGVVSFSDNATLLTGLSSSYSATQTKIQSITAGGNTNIGAAMKAAYQEIYTNGRIGVKHVIILLTDGDATVSSVSNISPDQYAIDQSSVAKIGGAIIYTIGLGADVNPSLLKSVSSVPGNYYYSPTGNDLASIYLTIAEISCTAAPANVSGLVTYDSNGNGLPDSGEVGFPNSQIYLISADGSKPTRTITSTADGTYLFDNVIDGTYQLCNTPPLGMHQTYPVANNGCYAMTVTQGINISNVSFLDAGTIPPPIDLCPNLTGIQTIVPSNMTLDTSGNCVVFSQPDACPNIAGVQTSVPNGDVYDVDGNCVPTPTTDLCPNITGVQTTIPAGKILDGTGQCVDDICPNVVNYSSVPLYSAGPFRTNVSSASSIGFGVKTFDTINPAHTTGDFYTENSLNGGGKDQMTTFNPSTNEYVLGLEDTPGGDNDFNDLVTQVDIACSTPGSPCPLPSALSDTTPDTINASPGGEQSLQTIINNAGFSFNVTANQDQYQVWNVPVNLSLTINTKFLNKFAGHSFVFGYYTNNSTTNFFPIFKTANIVGSTTVPALCVPNPSDYCPNIAGVQTSIPPGMALNTAGECVNIVPDVCPNIAGSQLTIPDGDSYDQFGNCIPISTVDMCPNIAGNQATVPAGMTLNTAGQCVNVTQPDACPNIAGVQNDVPSGYVYDLSGNCVPISSYDLCPNIAGIQNAVPDGMTLNTSGQCVVVSEPDACPNIAGNQTTVPNGYIYDMQGNCVPIIGTDTDICPNIDGVQTSVPDGMTLNTAGQCVVVSGPDACPNLADNQATIPNGYIYDTQGNCVPIGTGKNTDLCPNIAGFQTTIPAGMTLNTAGQCVNVTQPDACPNIAGVQTDVPPDMIYDLSGNCISISIVDACPNIAGNQATVPDGMTLDTAGQCVIISQPDACPNISGVQNDIPSGYVYDLSGNCVQNKNIDLCPNIDGIQNVLPDNTSIDSAGNCVNNFCIANPTLCTPPPDACTIDPASCTPGLDFCTKNPTLCTPPPDACTIDPASCKSPSDFCTKNPARCIPPPDACFLSPASCEPLKNFCLTHSSYCSIPVIGKLYNLASDLSNLLPQDVTNFVTQNEKGVTAASAAGIFSFLLADFARIWQWLLWLFGFAKRKKWGTVYDSVTKYPLDPAYVTASDLNGKIIAESITDLDGRYGFLLQPGSYRIVANKTNYKFPSERLARMPVDEVYDDLYFGEIITISHREEIILKNIPMDPIAYDWNEAEKQRTNLGTYSRKIGIKKLFGLLFYIGFVMSLIILLVAFSWWHLVILCSYIILFFLKPYGSTSGSRITYKSTKGPVAYAIVTIYTVVNNRKVIKRVTSPEGKFFSLLPNGYYYMTIETKNNDGTYALAHTSKTFRVKRGFVNENISI